MSNISYKRKTHRYESSISYRGFPRYWKGLCYTSGKRRICRSHQLRHSEEQAQKVLDEIVAAGGTAITYKADVSDLNQVKQMVKDVSKELGGIDVLVNNAGIVRDEYLLMLNKDTLDTCMDLNVKGYFYCAQQAVLKMFRKKSGSSSTCHQSARNSHFRDSLYTVQQRVLLIQ